LSPLIPMLFMGDEYGEKNPFLYFTAYDDKLAAAVREGRRKEFAKFPEFNDATKRARIPDPNDASTFAASRPTEHNRDEETLSRIKHLIALRRREIVPWLDHKSTRSAATIGDKALCTSWHRDDGFTFYLCVNFGDAKISTPSKPGKLLYSTSDAAAVSIENGLLEPTSLVAWLG
jgi:maltooligosyltrehalose trehalohydrolase